MKRYTLCMQIDTMTRISFTIVTDSLCQLTIALTLTLHLWEREEKSDNNIHITHSSESVDTFAVNWPYFLQSKYVRVSVWIYIVNDRAYHVQMKIALFFIYFHILNMGKKLEKQL